MLLFFISFASKFLLSVMACIREVASVPRALYSDSTLRIIQDFDSGPFSILGLLYMMSEFGILQISKMK